MSRIRSTGTGIESTLVELVKRLDPPSEIVEHADDLPGKPDIWLPDLGVAIFADGCFFHGCPEHFIMPEKNREYWEKKIERNRERDQRVVDELAEESIRAVRIWGHVLREDPTHAKATISEAIDSN